VAGETQKFRPVTVGGLTGLVLKTQYDKGHTSPTGGLDRSDRSTRSLSRIKESWCFSSCKGLPCWVSRTHPLNIKGHGRLRDYHPFHFYLQTLAYPTTLLSLFVSTAFKDVMSGPPTSEQPYACPSLTGSLQGWWT
jgi:hypothetical protein